MIKLPRLLGWQLTPVLLSLLFFPLVWLHLGKEWLAGEQDLAHGIPALLTYLFVLTRVPFTQHRVTRFEQILSFGALLITATLYMLAELVNIDLLTYLSLLIALPFLIASLYGWSNAFSCWHLHIFFLLPLPLWDSLLEPLVHLASWVSSTFMTLFHLPMLIEGNSITIPTGRILIAEGCSGIRYFLVSLILSYLLSALNGYNGWRLLVTVLIGATLGLIANWIRIILLIFIGYYSEMKSSLMTDHESFGWIVFAMFCLPTLYFAPHHTIATTQNRNLAHRPAFKTIMTLIVFAIITTTTILWLRIPNTHPSTAQTFNRQAWFVLPKYSVIGVAPPTIPATVWRHRTENVSLVLVQHKRLTAEDKLVPFFYQSRVGEHWFLEKTTPLIFENQTLQGEIFKSLTTNQRVLSLQVFHVGGSFTSSYFKAKLLQIPALLSKQNAFNYFLLQIPCSTPDCSDQITPLHTAFDDLTLLPPSHNDNSLMNFQHQETDISQDKS